MDIPHSEALLGWPTEALPSAVAMCSPLSLRQPTTAPSLADELDRLALVTDENAILLDHQPPGLIAEVITLT